MRFRRKPTKPQRLMIWLMGIAFASLAVWLIPELIGVFNPGVEDTFSEWVFDLPFVGVVGISILFGLTGVAFVWAAGHFLEGYARRRKKERG